MLLLASLLLRASGSGTGFTNQYSFSLKPFPNYDFHWKTDNENIYIALNVSCDGWVGFGISEPTSGSMPGSDVFRAYVNPNGQATIQDGYALTKSAPTPDTCQDWVLVSSQRVNGRSIVEASRKLVTSDPQDRPVSTTSISRLVFSFSAYSSFGIGHDANRIGLAVNLADGTIPLYEPTGNVQYFDIRNSYTPPVQETEYYDKLFNVPVAGPVHMIGAAVLKDSPYFNLVHHITLAGYYANQNNHYMYIWAPGVGDLDLKAPCGFRLGNASQGSVVQLHLQTHYNNPTLMQTGVDTSGVRIYYTTTLRNHDCGVINFGDPSVQLAQRGETLPAGLSAWEITCPATLTAALQSQVMNVFASALHMHALGQQMWTTVNGNVQNKIDFYDFGFQQGTDLMDKGFTIKAGDVIKTTCVYHAPDANQVFGLASDQEMCINYVFYYPRVPISSCGVETTGVTYTKTPLNQLYPRAFASAGGNCTQSPTTAAPSLAPTAHGSTSAPTTHGSTGAPTTHGSSGAPTTHGSSGAPTTHGSTGAPVRGPKGGASSAFLAPIVIVAMAAIAMLH